MPLQEGFEEIIGLTTQDFIVMYHLVLNLLEDGLNVYSDVW